MSYRIKIVGTRQLRIRLNKLKKPIDRPTAKRGGESIVSQMKGLIRIGVSPIQGKGRFPRYKNPKRYPGKRKSKRPVNLKLTGQFLRSLVSKAVSGTGGFAIQVEYNNALANKKEDGHRKGQNKQPKRPTIPQGNEKFSPSVLKGVIKIFEQRIQRIINGR